MPQKKIGELLKDAGLIDEYDIEMALKRQKTRGGLFGSNLVMTNAIGEVRLLRFLAEHTGVKEVNLNEIDIPRDLQLLLPEQVADKFNVVPIEKKEPKTLVVACADPTDLATLDELSFITGYHIEPVLAVHSEIYGAFSRLYHGIGIHEYQKKERD